MPFRTLQSHLWDWTFYGLGERESGWIGGGGSWVGPTLLSPDYLFLNGLSFILPSSTFL